MRPVLRKMRRLVERDQLVIARAEDGGTLRHHLRQVIASHRIDCIVDIGANTGQYGQMLRLDVGWRGPIESFEPARGPYRALVEATRDDPSWNVHQIALGSSAGAATLHTFGDSRFNSLHTTSEFGSGHFNELGAETGSEQVTVDRADAVIPTLTQARRMLLKIDTQGHDVEVLHGATDLLDRVAAIQMEAPLKPLYSDAMPLPDVLRHLASLGFAVSGMFPIVREPSLALVEVDVVAVKDEDGTGH